MLSNVRNFKKIYIAIGYIDLHRGIEGLAGIIRFQFHLDPYDENIIFFFCGRCCDRIKALILEEDGFLLCYKRVGNGSFSWPRSAHEAREILARHPIEALKAVSSIM